MMRNLGQSWSELRCKGYRSFDYINQKGGGWGVVWLWGGLIKVLHTVSNTLLDGEYAHPICEVKRVYGYSTSALTEKKPCKKINVWFVALSSIH